MVAPGPSEAFLVEVGAAGASPVAAAAEEAFLAEVLPSAAAEEAAAPLPCRAAGRTSGLAASRPGAYALRVSRAGGSFEGAAAALRCVGGSARTRRLGRCAGGC